MKKTLLLKSFVLIFISICAFKNMNAQIVGTNVFLQGFYVEVGINQCGAYASDQPAPAGYHPNVATGLGFVADSDEDGWDVGTPNYCGDYFVPGTPEEGWAMQIGTDVYYNSGQYCGSDDITGEITDYTYSSGIYTAVWEGSIGDLDIQAITTLPEDKDYFVTRILLCNNGATSIDDVYYERNVDPDNDQPWSGDFTTDNIIVYQPPADEQALVTSEGLTYGCFLGIGARDTNARVSYGNFLTTDGTPKDVWDGTGGYSSSGESVGDIANSISIYVPSIPAGQCKCVAFAYILNADDLDEALEATVTYTLTANGEPVPSSGEVFVCNVGDSVALQIVGAEDYDWTWSPSGGLSSDTGSSVIAVIDSTVTLTAIGTGGFCGDATVGVTIILDDAEFANAGDDAAICIGASTTLNGDGGDAASQYLWSPATGLSDPTASNPTATPVTSTVYTLITTDTAGCTATDNVAVTVNPLPNIDAGSNVSICVDGEVQLEATGGVSYVWSPTDGLSDPFSNNPICTVDVTTVYTVVGTDANGCVNTDDVTVNVDYLPPVTATTSPDTIDIYLGEIAQLNATGAATYVWSPAEGLFPGPYVANPTAQPSQTTTYIVTGTDANGCVNSDTVTVYVIGELNVALPNAFSPNGDGINDFYAPVVIGSGDITNFVIYNRWGQLVFESNSKNIGWDGTFNGKVSDIGSYVIYVTAKTSLNEPRTYQGSFTLIK